MTSNVMDEETYLSINGASRQDIGDSAFHKNKGSLSDKTWSKMTDKDFTCEKIRAGKYKYRGWIVSSVGYYHPQHCVVWEAYDPETGCADFHAFSKKAIKRLIDDSLAKEMEETKWQMR